LERFVAVGALALTALVVSAGAAHAAPPACSNSPQITDDSGDGHHASSDVVAAWFTEAGGKLQAVIQVRAATFLPEHGDADVNGSGFALLFSVNGQLDYVRTRAALDGTLTYDYGTYAPGAFFTTLGATTGSVERGPGTGATTIDIPAALGATPGTLLGAPFALTYDGISGGVPAWVDHAPGAEDPGDPARGADYVVGACGSGGGGPGGVAVRTLAVTISAPSKLTGGGRAIVSGNVTPARAGVEVSVTRSAHATRATKVRTEADGSYALLVPVNESTRVQAVAEGIHSGTRTIGVRSRTRLRVRHAHSGAAYLSGTVAPALPGRALLLRPDSPAVLARAAVTRGRFAFHRRLRGAYQVVYVPSGERAERSSSNTARIR
jgi:hypothetical protein